MDKNYKNPEFEKAQRELLGEAYDNLFCPMCKSELVECPKCSEFICKECLE